MSLRGATPLKTTPKIGSVVTVTTVPTTHTPLQRADRPDPAWVRGRCPECGDELVSHLYYKRNEGYVIQWECWASRGESPTCGYKKVL